MKIRERVRERGGSRHPDKAHVLALLPASAFAPLSGTFVVGSPISQVEGITTSKVQELADGA